MELMEFEKIFNKDELNKYQSNKVEWLESKDNGIISDLTKITYYRIFNTHILPMEEAKGKDVRFFTAVEIETLIKGIITNSMNMKRTVYSAINSYISWSVERGEVTFNPCDSIMTEDLFKISARAIKSIYTRLDEFYKYIDTLICTDIDRMMFTLIRYGVAAKEIPYIRWDDLDKEKMILKVDRNGNIVELPVDSDFIYRVNLAKECTDRYRNYTDYKKVANDEKDKSEIIIIDYIDKCYMIKNIIDEPINLSTLYNTILKICTVNNIPRIDLGVMNKCRRYDLALKLEEEKQITSDDLREILITLGLVSSANAISTLKKELKDIFNIDVVSKSKKVTGRKVKMITEDGDTYVFNTIGELARTSEKMFGSKFDRGAITKVCKGERPHYKSCKFEYIDEE